MDRDLSRRDFLASSLSMGIAPMVMPFPALAGPRVFPEEVRERVSPYSRPTGSPPRFYGEVKDRKAKLLPEFGEATRAMARGKSLRQSFTKGGYALTAALKAANREVSRLQNEQARLLDLNRKLVESYRQLTDEVEGYRMLMADQLRQQSAALDLLISEREEQRSWAKCEVHYNNILVLFPRWLDGVNVDLPIVYPASNKYELLPGPSALGLLTAYQQLMDCEDATYSTGLASIFPSHIISKPVGNFSTNYRGIHHWKSLSGNDVRVAYRCEVVDQDRVSGVVQMDVSRDGDYVMRIDPIKVNSFVA